MEFAKVKSTSLSRSPISNIPTRKPTQPKFNRPNSAAGPSTSTGIMKQGAPDRFKVEGVNLARKRSKRSASTSTLSNYKPTLSMDSASSTSAPVSPLAGNHRNPFDTSLLRPALQLPTPFPSYSNSPSPSPSGSPAPSDSSASGSTGSAKKIKSKHTPEAEAKRILRELMAAKGKDLELEICRREWEAGMQNGGVAFLALDVETWERQHGALLEFGWSFVEFSNRKGAVQVRREDQHIIVKENSRRRNGKFSPDARDDFDFGKSLILPQASLFNLLHALLATLSESTPLFLIFHDSRSDLVSLANLGFDPTTFSNRLANQKYPRTPHSTTEPPRSALSPGIYVTDTQVLYSAWEGRKGQVRLALCLEKLEVDIKGFRPHNAGNDAHATIALFEKLMDRNLRPPPPTPQIQPTIV